MAGRIAYLGNIVTQGLVLDLDAAIKGSYPGTGSIWTDVSNNGNNGTLINGPTFSSADYGSIVFDGTDDYVDCGTANPIPNNWTLGGWINQKRTTGTSTIIARSAGGPLYEQNAILGWSSTISSSFYIAGKLTNGTYYYQCTSSVFTNTGSILNVVGIFNEPTTTLTLYVNGAPVNTKNTGFSMTLTGSQRIQIGCSDGNNPSNFFSGSIYNTQIYNQSLTQFQVWQNFNSYKSRYGIPDIVTDGLVLNLDAGNPYSYLSGSSGTTWSNTVAVSSSISGTLVNGTTYSNGAITFDGVDDYVNLPSNFTNITSSTYVFTFNLSSVTGSVKGLVGYGNNSANYTCNFRIGSSGDGVPTTGNSRLIIRAYNPPSSIDNTIIGQTNINANTTYIVAFVISATSYKIYINGIEETLTVFGGTNDGKWIANCSSIPTNISISSIYYSGAYLGFLSGRVPVVQIYNRALSQAEITQNFNALRGRYGI
jgi:hypothetical protein